MSSSQLEGFWVAVKWILKYLNGAIEISLTFMKANYLKIEGFRDSNYASDLERRRSVLSYVFQVGGNTVSWKASLQNVVSLSTT